MTDRERLLAARTRTWGPADREAVDAVVAALRPSARHLSDVLDWLDDLSARTGVTPAEVLADPELVRLQRGSGSVPDRLKHWKGRLRRLRYPRLAEREAAVRAILRELPLGRRTRIVPPVDLEGGTVTVTIEARSIEDLRQAVQSLLGEATEDGLTQVFTLLTEV